jgi:histidine triad (HIT) family protein
MEPDPSKMSPSELEEMQRKNCVFCHIASGKVPAKKVYEDEHCIAVLDINPATLGHMLLMPKEHYTVMFQLPDQLAGHLLVIAKGLSQAGLKAFQSKGTTIFAANGVAAGQRAPHFMLHIIPRAAGDNVGIYIPSRTLPEKEAEQISKMLASELSGRKIEPETKPEPAGEKKEAGKREKAKPEKSELDKITKMLAGEEP